MRGLLEPVARGSPRLRSDWRVLLDEDRPTDEQMPFDARLAAEAMPSARFFRWSAPALSLGYRQQRPAWLAAGTSGVDWVERPTGGGLAFHGSDVSVSVVVPRALGLSLAQLMRAVGHAATQLCRSYGAEAVASDQPAQGPITYCLAEPSPYAITVGDRKLAGLAVRRYPESWLIQGSLLIQPVPDALRQVVPRDVLEVLARRAISLAEAVKAPMSERDAAHRWAGRWMEWWEDGLIREWAGAR